MSLITITSGIGCGETIVAQKVAEGLKMELYDDARLQKEAISMGYSSEDLKGFDQKAPGFELLNCELVNWGRATLTY